MNILILNWRDPKNPKAGGAEKLNLRILEVFQKKGAKITWYAQSVAGLLEEENYKGIKIIRKGRGALHFLYLPFLISAGKFDNIDLIIDCIHGFGYLSPFLFSKTKRMVLICEVAKNIWDEMASFPLSKTYKFMEPLMFKFYKKEQFWTISKSTEADLIDFGIEKKRIEVLPMGFDAITVKIQKYKTPAALFVGRLTQQKGVKDAIRAIALVNKDSKRKWRLNIIGRGSQNYEDELKEMVKEFKIQKYVNFLGFVAERTKFVEMAKAWVLLVPSSREGWGMIIPEANYSGTPAIVYSVPGLVDSAKRYSKENRIVDPGGGKIAEALSKIKSPVKVVEKIEPGWRVLQNYVKSLKL